MAGDMGAVRSPISYVFFGVVDFICLLMAAESLNALQYMRAVEWAIAGVAAILIGYYWSQIKVTLGIGKGRSALPEHRPNVLPTRYGENDERNAFGLFLRNPGYDALDVHIPNIPIGPSTYLLSFPGIVPLLCERDHIVFVEGWLEDKSGALPGLDGGRLHDVMRLANVEQIEFTIQYKGTDFRDYKTHCVIERVNWKDNGLVVRAINQE